MKVKELMDSLKGDCYRFRVHYPEEWEFGLITGATFFGNRGLVLQHGEDDVSSFTLNPSWLSCEDERRTEYKENEWLPCDESGRIDDGYGNEPDAIVAYFSSLEGSREERAFELAKNEYLAWLEHRTDRYTTVYGYMKLGDRNEQHLL